MTVGYIRYRSDYKYQLAGPYQIDIPIELGAAIDEQFITLSKSGRLVVKSGYAWDGPSGPVIDTDENMRASLVHDALYQLMRLNVLSSRRWRRVADALFRDLCKEDGVPAYKANIYFKALRKHGRPNTDPQNKKIIHRAPAS